MPFPFPGDLPYPEIEPAPLMSPALAGGFFTMGATWEANQGKVKMKSSPVVSDSLQPPGLYSPWNSPGQNTGVGSRSVLQGNLPNPGIKLRSPAFQADFLQSEPPGKPKELVLHPKLV